MRELTRRNARESLQKVIHRVNQKFLGWIQFFRMAKMRGLMQGIGQWLRLLLRCMRLEQCKRPYATVRFLMALGESRPSAWRLALTGKGRWRRADTPQAHRTLQRGWFMEIELINPEAGYLAARNAC